MAPVNEHQLNVAHPIYETPGIASGTFTFPDAYLSPQIQYLNFPPTTEITIGGRLIEIPKQVSVKCRILEPHEDRLFWIKKIQHKHRVCLGKHHRDFGDVEVAFSYTSPCTHLWFAGYAIHIDEAVEISFLSYNATIKVAPDDVLGHSLGEEAPTFPVGSGMEVRRIRTRVRKPKHHKEKLSSGVRLREEVRHGATTSTDKPSRRRKPAPNQFQPPAPGPTVRSRGTGPSSMVDTTRPPNLVSMFPDSAPIHSSNRNIQAHATPVTPVPMSVHHYQQDPSFGKRSIPPMLSVPSRPMKPTPLATPANHRRSDSYLPSPPAFPRSQYQGFSGYPAVRGELRFSASPQMTGIRHL